MDNNIEFLIMGYVAGFLILGILLSSLWWRYRSVMADEAALDTLESEIRE